MPDDWWHKTFQEAYLRSYRDLFLVDRPKEAVAFIIRRLRLRKNSRVLDLACGHGRHLLELSKHGYRRLEGLDQSALYISMLRRAARAAQAQIRTTKRDYRDLNAEGRYDAIYCLYTSFGYLPTATADREVLVRVFRALKPCGRFLLDLNNARRTIAHIRKQPGSYWNGISWHVSNSEVLSDGLRIRKRYSYHPSTRIWRINRRWNEAGRANGYRAEIRLYSLTQIVRAARQAGFSNCRAYGDFHGASFSRLSPRMILVMERPPALKRVD